MIDYSKFFNTPFPLFSVLGCLFVSFPWSTNTLKCLLLNIRKQHSLSSCIILVNHPFSSTLQLSSSERIVFYTVSPSSPWKNIKKIYIGLFLVMKQNDNTEDYIV